MLILYSIVNVLKFFGAVAQLGEHFVRNEGVGGSTPPSSTSFARVPLLRPDRRHLGGKLCRWGRFILAVSSDSAII
jgi:hypothetical protein